MSDNNQPDKQIEKEKENKDGEVSEESEESEESEKSEENEGSQESEEEEVEKVNIPIKRKKEDYSFRSHNTRLEPTRKLYGDEWQFPVNVSDELSDSDCNSQFELGDEIQTFN
jgi:hypothetical protein